MQDNLTDTSYTSKPNQNIGHIYSIDEKLTISMLKSQKFDPNSYDPKKIQAVKKYCIQNNIHIAIDGDTDYHWRFHKFTSKPYIYHYIGDISILNRPILAIVGPRKASQYGKEVTQDLISSLAGHDVVTISGLAEGIDELCHISSIEHQIPTIAVLGGGLTYFLMHQRRHLIERIVSSGGLIISEFKLKQKPAPYTFPQRNRIIAGLADMLRLPQAAMSSGTLITAQYAIDSHKEVYTCPQSIYDTQSQGSNHLISQGLAHCIYDIDDFVDSKFGYKTIYISDDNQNMQDNLPNIQSDLDDTSRQILSAIAQGYGDISSICSMCDIDISVAMTHLTILEMSSIIYTDSPGSYRVR